MSDTLRVEICTEGKHSGMTLFIWLLHSLHTTVPLHTTSPYYARRRTRSAYTVKSCATQTSRIRLCGSIFDWDLGRIHRTGGLVGSIRCRHLAYILTQTTGNAWAAAGATRVLQTLAKSYYSQQLKDDMWELAGWITEILTASWVWQVCNLDFQLHLPLII
jgi:hypothetical protein